MTKIWPWIEFDLQLFIGMRFQCTFEGQKTFFFTNHKISIFSRKRWKVGWLEGENFPLKRESLQHYLRLNCWKMLPQKYPKHHIFKLDWNSLQKAPCQFLCHVFSICWCKLLQMTKMAGWIGCRKLYRCENHLNQSALKLQSLQ